MSTFGQWDKPLTVRLPASAARSATCSGARRQLEPPQDVELERRGAQDERGPPMSTLAEALLAVEPTPPDEVKPRAVPYERLDVSVMRPPGCLTWRVSVLVHVEAGPPHAYQGSAGTMVDGWNQALQFVERATGVVR